MVIYYKKLTNKLFFGKYVYKVALYTPFASYFRGKQLENIKFMLNHDYEQAKLKGENKIRIRSLWRDIWATEDDYLLAVSLIDHLEDLDDFVLRVEGRVLGVYFNEESYIDIIANIPGAIVKEISRPKDEKTKEYLLSTPKVIIRKDYTHKYKVTVNSMVDSGESFKKWATNIPKIKLSSSNLRWEGHFYVADEKTLNLCRIFLGDRIRKVEKLVTSEEI